MISGTLSAAATPLRMFETLGERGWIDSVRDEQRASPRDWTFYDAYLKGEALAEAFE